MLFWHVEYYCNEFVRANHIHVTINFSRDCKEKTAKLYAAILINNVLK